MKLKVLIVLSLAIFIQGCLKDSSTTGYTVTLSATDVFNQPSNTYTQGEKVQLNLAITNTGNTDISVLTGSCLASYEIFNSSGSSIGNVPIVCLAVVPTPTPLKPGNTLSESILWLQDTTSSNTQLPIGTYNITGTVPGLAKKATITISII